MATLWGSANSTLPRVNYIKAVDVYLLTSFVFVLCTLIEYVLVLNCEHIQLRRKKKKDRGKEVGENLNSQRMLAESKIQVSCCMEHQLFPRYFCRFVGFKALD